MNNENANSSWNEIFESMKIPTNSKGDNKEIAVILESDFDSLFNEEDLIKDQPRNLDKTLNELRARVEVRYNYIKDTVKYSSNYILAELSVQEGNEEKAKNVLDSFEEERIQKLKYFIAHRQIPEDSKD